MDAEGDVTGIDMILNPLNPFRAGLDRIVLLGTTVVANGDEGLDPRSDALVDEVVEDALPLRPWPNPSWLPW
jgi:hypothetical protein